ncbi:hypothetical protein [Methylobacter sp.]|uniref:hypothetical protein n=1 Tax=Methylobacter sp. TaxID=2051955 RepID=UPI002488236A|nr:hypothetical protein [Methylobacter sp.]MDI1278043.1 hypothetical protein [Methylobacter sp.]
MKNKIIIVAVLCLLAGCAGSKINFDQARKVEVGMTEAQLTQLMGDPYQIISKGENLQIWIWSHYNGLSGTKSLVSFPMQSGKVISVPAIPKSFD